MSCDMSNYNESENLELGGDLTTAVKHLIIINTTCFLVQQFLLPHEAFRWLALVPDLVVHQFAVWQLVTHMFLHGDLFHLLFNMLALWFIGRELELYWGTREFVHFYLVCGIGAAIFDIVIDFLYTHQTTIPSIGASGAIYGLLMAFGILFWNRYITLVLYFFLPVTMQVKYLVIGLALIALYSGVALIHDGVGHFAHLGGMLVGFLYMKLIKPSLHWGENIFNKKPGESGMSRLIEWLHQRMENREGVRRRQQEAHVREHLDLLLDKINAVGYENLTADEKQMLKNASEYLGRKNS
jgi:membrane associated rhomboid family serine protease